MSKVLRVIFYSFVVLAYTLNYAHAQKESPLIFYNSVAVGGNLSSFSNITPSLRINFNRVGFEINCPTGNTRQYDNQWGYFEKESTFIGGVSVFYYLKQTELANFYAQVSSGVKYTLEHKRYRQYKPNGNFDDVEVKKKNEYLNLGFLFGAEKNLNDFLRMKASVGYGGYSINYKNSSYFLFGELGMYIILR